MDWNSVTGIIMALVVGIGLPLALRKRKKAGPLRRDELYEHLQQMGVTASLAEKGGDREKVGLGRFSGQRSEGIILLQDREMDCINVISVSSQYAVNFFLDYLVKSPHIAGQRELKKMKLVKKKSQALWGKVVAIEWKGDQSLAQSLNLDYRLEARLLQVDLNALKEGIQIIPEPKHGYVRIRTSYHLPSRQMFEAVGIVARYAKSY